MTLRHYIPHAVALLLIGMVLAKCNPFPGWMPQDFPNKHRPKDK